MAINYIVTKRVLNFDPEKKQKYVARPVTNGMVSFEKLCKQITQVCGAHRGQVQLVIAGLIDCMSDALDDGKSVRLGDFGIFRPTMNARAEDEAADANANSVKRLRINFHPGKIFRNTLDEMSIEQFTIPTTEWSNFDDTDENGYINL